MATFTKTDVRAAWDASFEKAHGLKATVSLPAAFETLRWRKTVHIRTIRRKIFDHNGTLVVSWRSKWHCLEASRVDCLGETWIRWELGEAVEPAGQ